MNEHTKNYLRKKVLLVLIQIILFNLAGYVF